MAATPRARKVGKCGRLKAELGVCRRSGARITARDLGAAAVSARLGSAVRWPPEETAREGPGNVTRSTCHGERTWAGACRPEAVRWSHNAGVARVSHQPFPGKECIFFAIVADRATNFSGPGAMTRALFFHRGVRGGAGVLGARAPSCPQRRSAAEIVTEVGLGHRSAAMAREAGGMAHPLARGGCENSLFSSIDEDCDAPESA
jgi:hypothetical protein